MKIPAKKYEIGYRRPPKHTRWKKGQCGNPNRIRNRSPKPAVQMIDEIFASKIDIIEKDMSRPVTAFEAILLQLWIKMMGGSKRAMRVLLKYQEFAAAHGDMGGVEIETIIREEPGSEND